MFGRSKAHPAAKIDISSLLIKVDESREQIATLRAERQTVLHAPRPLAEILAALDDWLDDAATNSVDRLRLGQLTRRDMPAGIQLPFSVDRQTAAIDASAACNVLLGLVIAVARPTLRQIIEGQLADMVAARPGLTDAEQAARLAELDRQILTTELTEEHCIRALEAAGVPILRRPDAAPMALLATDGALPAL